jgi:carbonic anhydrase/acetyltransferase-like protein (isoleucine patch superfamily)
MIMGRPAKVVRELNPEELAFLRKSAQNYLYCQTVNGCKQLSNTGITNKAVRKYVFFKKMYS